MRTDRDLPDDAVRWDDVVRPADAPATLPAADIDPDDDATIFYTSGTTGFPKGAQITHRGSVHNVLDLVFWTLATATAEAKAIAAGDLPAPSAPTAPPAQHVFMAPTPLFHVTACNCILHPCTLAGGRIVLMHKWDAGRALELIEREGVTNFSGVPTMSRELLAHPDWATRDTSSLRGLAGGGAPVQPDLVDKIEKSLGRGGPSTGYGLTETHGIVTANALAVLPRQAAVVRAGRAHPRRQARRRRRRRCCRAGPDAVGELCVRGPVVIKGYLNRPEATAEAIADGWFHTGDIARIDDDGFVFIVDRAKDMVLRGGENVYCSEVEAAIYEHDDVAEAAVFGVPDERLGEDGRRRSIVLRAGIGARRRGAAPASSAARIAKLQDPGDASGSAISPLPRNANGKFLKRQLRDELANT